MNHDNVHDLYKKMLPSYEAQTEIWFPNGYGSIRVRLFNGVEYVFTANDSGGITFECLKDFVAKMEKGVEYHGRS